MATKKDELFETTAVEPVKQELQPVGDSEASVFALLQAAVDKGIPVETMEKLVALHERVADRRAAQEFAEAMSRFQAACPPIQKQSEARITTKSGTQYRVKYAELDTIARIVNPILRECGLSYSWDSAVEAKQLKCICTLRHVNGHSVSASFSCPTDASGAMNEQQKVAAALTYARRQSLVQVLGLTTTEPDTDGVSSETVSESQAADLRAKVKEVAANEYRFLTWLGVECKPEVEFEDYKKILASDYARALSELERRGARR